MAIWTLAKYGADDMRTLNKVPATPSIDTTAAATSSQYSGPATIVATCLGLPRSPAGPHPLPGQLSNPERGRSARHWPQTATATAWYNGGLPPQPRLATSLIGVIDIETTGIDPASDVIIEIARVDMVRGGGITNAMDTLVRPGRPISPGASAIHRIIDEDLKDAPLLADIIDRFKGADAYVAHNCAFERSEFGPWILTYKCALRVWPDLDGIAIRNCVMPSAAPRPSPDLSAARSRPWIGVEK